MIKLFRYFLTFVIFGSGYALAQAPVISSASTASATVGVPFSYEITTVDDDALVYGVAGTLPEGVTRSGAILSGTPKEAGSFSITLSASNLSGEGTLVLTLTVANPLPIITSDMTVQAQVGSPFSYQISALYAPTSFNAVGLTQIGGLTLDTTTGSISGVPDNSGDFDVLLIANNSSGEGSAEIKLVVLPAQTLGGAPNVQILYPTLNSRLEGDFNTVFISAAITPSSAGEVIDTVYVEWRNPPPLPGSPLPRAPVILGTLSQASTDGSSYYYEGNVSTGFNPDGRELGGGAIELAVVEDVSVGAESSISNTLISMVCSVLPISSVAVTVKL